MGAAGRRQLCWCGGGEQDRATATGARRPPPASSSRLPARPPSGRPQPCGSLLGTHPRPTPRASAASCSEPACRHRAKFRPRPPSAVQGSSASAPGPRLPASPGPGTMSEKSVEAAAELSAKDLKEKKDKVEEKAGRKERKKEVVEEEENGAEEEEEETAEDGEDDDEGDEEG